MIDAVAARELAVRSGLSRQTQVSIFLQFRELVLKSEKLDFDSIGFNVYSETNEDGILLYIFAAIGMETRRCVDIGAGRITGSNVANLIVNHDFYGLLVDANGGAVADSAAYYREHPHTRHLPPQTVHARVTAENVNTLLSEHRFSGAIDLLCLDIDGIDYWILNAISAVQPRVMLVEYHDVLGPERSWTVPYHPDFDVSKYPANRSQNNYCGASLRAFVKLANERGYKLVGTNRGGWNALFVQRGLDDASLPEVSVESCFHYEWNKFSMATRFPLVSKLEWVEV